LGFGFFPRKPRVTPQLFWTLVSSGTPWDSLFGVSLVATFTPSLTTPRFLPLLYAGFFSPVRSLPRTHNLFSTRLVLRLLSTLERRFFPPLFFFVFLMLAIFLPSPLGPRAFLLSHSLHLDEKALPFSSSLQPETHS